jgi:hypothetical protein
LPHRQIGKLHHRHFEGLTQNSASATISTRDIFEPGGTLAIWSRNSRELFFQNPDHHIMATDYQLKNDSFVAGKPRVWSDQRLQDVSSVQKLRPGAGRQALCNNP